ncbi:MAG: hypothetical protein N2116_04480 [Armatimonadetes bacterium]|nr:hypothetical protein [Armatimonadota bacterium]
MKFIGDDIQQALTKAEKLLRVSEWAVEQELYDGAALCCYAALFWAAIAALAHQGIEQEEWAHGWLWKTFREELVRKRHIYPPVFVEWLERAYSLRDKRALRLGNARGKGDMTHGSSCP